MQHPSTSTALRFLLATLLVAMAITCQPALAAAPNEKALPDALATPDQVLAEALRQSIGSPAKADIGDQATDRLADGLLMIPAEPGARLFTVMTRPVPPGFGGLLIGSEGMEAPGIIRYVPAGFIDAEAIRDWGADDILASLEDTVEHANPERLKQNLQAREARRWIRPPRYDRITHQLTWAALVVPKTAPSESDGEVTYHAVGFGREGYVHLTVVSSVQKSDDIAQMADSFLLGLNFVPGKTYGDAVATDPRAPDGIAGVLGVESLHKARDGFSFWATDAMVPVVGGIVAGIGGISLLIYILKHLRRESRRV